MISGEVGIKKPSPEIFSIAIAETGLQPSEVAFVGDSIDDDMMGAAAAGKKVLHNWGRPGDTAVIAVDGNDMPLGAAWYRFWTSEYHSFGFVDESTPEVGIGVRVEKRRQGVGTALLQALLKQAAKQRIQRVSLSVDPDNYARKIYEKIGFKKVDVPDNSWTMVVDLASEKKKT